MAANRAGALAATLLMTAAVASCDDSVQRRSGVVTTLEGSLLCIAGSIEVCMSADDPALLAGIQVGDCVSTRSDFFGVPGGVGTREDPARLTSIREVDISNCQL